MSGRLGRRGTEEERELTDAGGQAAADGDDETGQPGNLSPDTAMVAGSGHGDNSASRWAGR